jgi:hypothetical protein
MENFSSVMKPENYPKLNCLDTYLRLEDAVLNRQSFSLIRLGDGEGALMGYPDITDRAAINRSFKVWFGQQVINDEDANQIASLIRQAVVGADIVGLPRQKQVEKHPYYQAVYRSISHYNLKSETQYYTDSAVHRYLQFTLLFRKLLNNQEFVGLITPRRIASKLAEEFNIGRVEHISIKGEAKFQGDEIASHFPDTFNRLVESIEPPYRGAVYLVGAGGLGKVYCNVIKQRGGIAVDIGALFDAWSNVRSRLIHPSHSMDRYKEIPSITAKQACDRFNSLCDHFDIDTERLDISHYSSLTDESW